jgi:hypothetical protein
MHQLAELDDSVRGQALEHFERLRPHLERGVPLPKLAREQHIPTRAPSAICPFVFLEDLLSGSAREELNERPRMRIVSAFLGQDDAAITRSVVPESTSGAHAMTLRSKRIGLEVPSACGRSPSHNNQPKSLAFKANPTTFNVSDKIKRHTTE